LINLLIFLESNSTKRSGWRERNTVIRFVYYHYPKYAHVRVSRQKRIYANSCRQMGVSFQIKWGVRG
jgi:hypothetical protein